MAHRRRSLSLITFPLAIATTLLIEASINSAQAQEAQIVPDNTLGAESSQVNASDPQKTQIDGGATRGENLFHSFEDFSVPTGGEAFFNNADSIANIFSRVTGGNISNIDGIIGAKGSANLFLLNPAGIIFGENASLNLGGSFFASTADSLVFENGLEFGASNPQAPPLLTIDIPIGLSFRDNPSSIEVKDSSNFFASPHLALIGGQVSLEGGRVFGGNITLGGLAAAGTVNINDDRSLIFPNDVAQANVSLNNGSFLGIFGSQGNSIDINASNVIFTKGSQAIASTGNDINIQALNTLSLSEESKLITQVSEDREGDAGQILINAGESITLAQKSLITSEIEQNRRGNANQIHLTTNSLELREASKIIGKTDGEGDTDNINIKAGNLVLFQNSAIQNQVLENAKGNAGDIDIKTNSLLLNNSLILADTKGQGNAGNIFINATDSISLDQESKILSQIRDMGNGEGGPIQITADNISLKELSQVSSNTGKNAIGDAGDVTLDAKTINISKGAIIDSITENDSHAGNVNITAKILELASGGKVITSTDGGGNAGDINLTIDESLEFDGSDPRLKKDRFEEEILKQLQPQTGLLASTSENSTGNGGNVDVISKTGSLTMTNDAEISIQSEGKGNAGNLNIIANSLDFNRGIITAKTKVGQGEEAANITLEVSDVFTFRNESLISAEALEDANGGNINIDTEFLIAFPSEGLDGSDIIAKASEGRGGEIDITWTLGKKAQK